MSVAALDRERVGDLTESEQLRELLYQAVHAHGLNPENIFLLLTRLLDSEFPEEPGENVEAKGRAFRRLVEADYPVGLGIKPAGKLAAIVRDFRHPNEDPPRRHEPTVEKMQRMRARVQQLLPGESSAHGTNQYTMSQDGHHNTMSILSDSVQGIVRRLNRDDPGLAQRVAAGQISANKAAEQAGYRPKKRTIRMDSAESAFRSITHHMTDREQLEILAELLWHHLHPEADDAS